MNEKTIEIPIEAATGYLHKSNGNRSAKVKTAQQTWLFALISLAWISGVAFFGLKTWFMVEGDFGPEKHPWQFPALQAHGLIAFLMMITYGYFLGTHVQQAWKVKPRRTLGIFLVGVPAFQMITAYLLYYVNWEDKSRQIIEYSHLGVGFLLPVILISHVFLPKFFKKRRLNRIAKSH